VHPGEIFGLLGPNGAGKTTFIKILLGIARKTSGEAMMLGHRAGVRFSRREIGYLPENLRIPRYHTARSALDFYGQLSGMPPREIRLRGDKLLELVGLLERARDNISQYSKGMLQRLGLAQALLHQPRLIILDEPTDGLDPVGRAQVRTLLQRLKDEGHTVFLNSHILQEVELVCDRVAILDHGELRFVGAVDTLREQLSGDCEKDFELTVEVRGEKSRLMSAMAQCSIQSWQPTSPSQYQVVVRFQDQQRVDQFVDGLRAAEISILNLQRQRLTLEDAFLKLLASKKA
jgi:ABC-2 type transport system ATP-binding protein